MKIAMVTGSPHKSGTTAVLAEEFSKGAEGNGHKIVRFDAAFEELHPCRACDQCIKSGGECIYQDAMTRIRPAIMEADVVVLVTPMYYFGMSAQLKMVIDRFYAFNDALLQERKKAVLLAACGDEEDWVTGAIIQHYKTICRYLNWESTGIVMAEGVYRPEDLVKTMYPKAAKELGKSII